MKKLYPKNFLYSEKEPDLVGYLILSATWANFQPIALNKTKITLKDRC